jgi:CheY-like chemotaxis protein
MDYITVDKPQQTKMSVRTCLLVTDDPDDHQAFSEALSEFSSKTVVVIVLDSDKALDLMKSKRHIPDYIFVDLSMQGIRMESFLEARKKDADIHSVPTVVYGAKSTFDRMEDTEGLIFFNKEYEYSELRNFLKEYI